MVLPSTGDLSPHRVQQVCRRNFDSLKNTVYYYLCQLSVKDKKRCPLKEQIHKKNKACLLHIYVHRQTFTSTLLCELCLPLQETVGTTSPLQLSRSWSRCLLEGHQSTLLTKTVRPPHLSWHLNFANIYIWIISATEWLLQVFLGRVSLIRCLMWPFPVQVTCGTDRVWPPATLRAPPGSTSPTMCAEFL